MPAISSPMPITLISCLWFQTSLYYIFDCLSATCYTSLSVLLTATIRYSPLDTPPFDLRLTL
jgi:hypothetical protein